jgi:predicted acyl esterase
VEPLETEEPAVNYRKMFVVAFVLAWTGGWSARAADPASVAVREERLWIPMRDGVKLSAFAYWPEGDGQWPVLLEQRYANGANPAVKQQFSKLAQHGYVVVLANFRGSQESEGVWQGYRALGWGELKDGYDLVEWLAAQPWSTGKVGTFGSSQAGFAQNFLAVTQPPHLVAQYMMATASEARHGRSGFWKWKKSAACPSTTAPSWKNGSGIPRMTPIGPKKTAPASSTR